jgi:hypothetical protein
MPLLITSASGANGNGYDALLAHDRFAMLQTIEDLRRRMHPDSGQGHSVLHTQQQAMTWVRRQVKGSFLAYADGVWVTALIPLVELQAEEPRAHEH